MITRKKKWCKGCESEQFLFGKKLCINCYNKQNNNGIKKSESKIPRISKTQKSREAKYKELQTIYLQNNPICECCATAKSVEIHHKAGRDGNNLFQHFLAVCRTCHDKIEMNPIWAKENGYSISRLN